MITRTLKPTTIVPKSLYVERAADRQLRAVVEDMGRPGYILVARQMGKTNLLLNMKRERIDDIVLYLDLSNRFDSAQSWFRHVIDALLESFCNEFPKSTSYVAQQRVSVSLEPSAEFDRHLRHLLRETTRQVIVILDEIDSLVNTPYSDIILSQVRSMYFSRANHPEYERLTYVLSGVAEPADLIKDKNISPFNIGEKIYLNNFDRLEFSEFLEKAKLPLTKAVEDVIFSWTSGNPRMSWDICAELELRQIAGYPIDVPLVNEVVEKLYFQEFDRAPVDHIRTLVASDSQIRAAIVELRYGKAEFIDNKIKSKLYLSGITTAPGGKNLQIASKIVDQCLSDEWLAQFNVATPNFISEVLEHYAAAKYEMVIERFEAALRDGLSDGKLTPGERMAVGMSYLHVGLPAKAIYYLERLTK